jgi:7,8-dihydropterin-6-yl-methyl-4-(beta-D-ribofuranosyl)aminobenzene 5'-phosphate synthase
VKVTVPALRLTVLCDNGVARPGVCGVHGLALLVEAGARRLLFDTGPDSTVAANAAVLGVPLSPLDAVVLSHGHYDHIGGLETVLRAAGPLPVVSPPSLFRAAHNYKHNGSMRYIGPPLGEEQYWELGASFIRQDDPAAAELLGPGFATTVRADELALIGLLPGLCVVLTGCAHGGAAGVVRQAKQVADGRPPRALLGGLHLGGVPDTAVQRLALRLHALGVGTVLPCHCTGPQGVLALKESFLGQVTTVGTGSVIEFDAEGTMRLT